jgi:3-hydroxypropanoate dehydrogenase
MTVTLETLFLAARTQNGYLPTPVSDEQLQRLYDVLKWGPTSANCSPARFVFVRSPEAKALLLPCVSPGNAKKVEQAPVTVLIGMDMAFPDTLPKLFPHTDARAWFEGKPELVKATAFRNSSLQGAYLMLAARALGLDCGPMSGFDADKLEAAFWPDSTVKANFICTLGEGDPAQLMPRSPRLGFYDACRLV